MILGIIGQMGSGKSTVAKYLETAFKASHYRFSDILREILGLLCIEATRINLIDLFLVLEPRFGANVLARPMAQAVGKDQNRIIAIEGIRREADIEELRKLPDFYLIGVVSQEQARYKRISGRGENTDDGSKTYEEFKEDHKLQTEVLIDGLVETADFVIQNEGTLADLQKKVDEIVLVLQK